MNNSIKRAMVLLLLVLVLVMGSGAVQAQTGCTNYGDYLHWISQPVFDDRAENIFVQGDYAYIPFWNSGVSKLVIVDFSNESQPVQVGEVDIPSPDAISVAVVGDIAAVGCATNSPGGLFLVDVSDPMAPAVVDSCLPGVNGMEMAVSGTTFYMASSLPDNRLYVVDVANPDSIVVHPSVPLPRLIRGDIAINGNYAYIADGDLVTVNISDPSSVYITNVQVLPDYRNVADLAYYNGWLYVASQHNIQFSVIYSFSLGNPAIPYRRAGITTDFHGNATYWPDIAVAAGVCYYGLNSYLVTMYDVSSPTNMSLIDRFPHGGGWLTDMTVFGSNLYDIRDVTQGGLYPERVHSIRVTSVSSPSPLEPLSSLSLAGETLGVVLSPDKSNIAYVAGGSAGLQIVDVSNPLAPALLGTADTPGQATEIVLVGATAFVADGTAGLQVVDVTNSNLPSVIGGVDTPGDAVDLAVVGDFAYLADTGGGLQIVDVAIPDTPSLRGAEISLTQASGVDVDGLVAYVANGSGGVKSVDVSDPDNPWIIDGVKASTVNNARKVDVSQGKAYVSDVAEGLAILDITDPSALQVISGLETENSAGDVDVWGIFAYVGSGSGVQLVDIRDAQNPLNVGKVVVPATSQGMFINQDYAYVATGGSGLQICPTQCGFDESVFAAYAVDVQEDQYPVAVQFTNQTVGYGLSYEWDFDDGSPITTEMNPSHTFTQPGDYDVTLTATNGVNVDVFTLTISAVDEPPTFLGVRDVPNDQGGWVYLDFYHSGYDNGVLNKSEIYTIQRQDDGAWIYVNSIGATGDHYYTVLVPTQGDGPAWDTTFRVIANMAEGNWASAPLNGHSLDNIAPQTPQNVFWNGPDQLVWDPVPDEDFAYYRVYAGETASFEDPTELTTTVQTSADLVDVTKPWIFVVAVDHAQQESQPSSPLAVSGLPELNDKVWLAQAAPNPFNPRTTIEYHLPRTMPARLRVYDISGRLVRTLVDGVVSAGRNSAVWQGRDDTEREVSSGTYFYRLETDSSVLTRRMTLVR